MDINSDPGCCSATELDMALSSSSSPEDTRAPVSEALQMHHEVFLIELVKFCQVSENKTVNLKRNANAYTLKTRTGPDIKGLAMSLLLLRNGGNFKRMNKFVHSPWDGTAYSRVALPCSVKPFWKYPHGHMYKCFHNDSNPVSEDYPAQGSLMFLLKSLPSGRDVNTYLFS
ncbi:hypothetical protein STEG23_033605 [Scotinomys teguina]